MNVDRTKQSNIKCAYCKYFLSSATICGVTGERKHYWNRCKEFEWEDNNEAVKD